MDSRLFEIDAQAALQTNYHWDDVEEGFWLETVQDCRQVIENNLNDQRDLPEGWKGEMHRVASIPVTLFMELQKKGITRDAKAFSRWLNDPDNRFFRTKLGRV